MANNLLRKVPGQGQRPPSTGGSGVVPASGNKATEGHFKSLGDFCHKVARREVTKALGVTTGVNGGYLVPPELVIGLDSVLQEEGLFFRFAWNLPMGSTTLNIPTYDLNHSHALGDTPLYGGMSLAWTQENVQLPSVAPTFSQSALVAKNLEGIVLVSDQMVADGGPALDLFLRRMFGYSICWYTERACFRGDVANQPEGLIASPSTVAVARNTASDVRAVDLAAMAGSLVPACYNRAIWAYHPSVVDKVAALSTFQISEAMGESSRLVHWLLGRPAYCTEKLPSLGNKGDVVLFDPTQYVLGVRQLEVAFAASKDVDTYSSRQSQYRIMWRGDGKFLAKGTVTLEDNSTTCGVSVCLDVPA